MLGANHTAKALSILMGQDIGEIEAQIGKTSEGNASDVDGWRSIYFSIGFNHISVYNILIVSLLPASPAPFLLSQLITR